MEYIQTFLSDTRRSCSTQSGTPAIATTEECFMGIDEAGRGPVLGKVRFRKNMLTEFCFRTNGVRNLLWSAVKKK